MLYAAELLWSYQGWTSEQRRRFEAFWRRRCLVHTEFVMLRANNWGDNALMGVLAAAIAFEDEALARLCLARLNDYFFGDWKMRTDERGTFLPHEVERNDGRSGITYTAYSLQALTQLLEMARNFGPMFDWWNRPTTGAVSMKALYEDYFRWNVLKEPFPWYLENFSEGEPIRTNSRANTLEIAYSRLKLHPRIGAWLEKNRPVNGAEGDPYATLLKGDL